MSRTGAGIRHSASLLSALVFVASLSGAQAAWAQADPGISTAQSAGPAVVGQPYTFSVTVTNNSVPQQVGLKYFLPKGMALDVAIPSQGTCGMSHHGTNAIGCVLGLIPSGGSVTVEITATPTVAGTFTNRVVAQGEVSPSTPESSNEVAITVGPAS